MNALPAMTSYVYAVEETTHYLLEVKQVGLINLAVRLPAQPPGPHPAVLVSYGATGASLRKATLVADVLTAAGLATVLFGRDMTGPARPVRPLADWRRALAWAAGHADLRADALAVWGFGRDGDDVRRLVATAPPGVRAAVAHSPDPGRTLRRTPVRSTTPLLVAISAGEPRHERRLLALTRQQHRVQWARYRIPADELLYADRLPVLLRDQVAFLRHHLA